MLELVQEQAEGVLLQLKDIAHKHAALSDGALIGLEYDPETYAGQDILKGTITGKPLPPAEANQIAVGVDKRYTELYDATSELPEIEAIAETLRSGQNAVIATDHRELIDIALQLLAVSSKLHLDKVPFKSGFVVSRMIDFLAIPLGGTPVPARELLELAFDRSYLTIPNTISTKSRIGRSAMEKYNDFVVNAIEGDVNRRPRSNRVPMLLGIAMPGTINKPLDATQYSGNDIPDELKEKSMVVGQISYGTLSFMKHALTYATITKMGETTDVRIDPIPLHVSRPEDIDRLADKLLRMLNERDTDTHYVYDARGNLPVLQRSEA